MIINLIYHDFVYSGIQAPKEAGDGYLKDDTPVPRQQTMTGYVERFGWDVQVGTKL